MGDQEAIDKMIDLLSDNKGKDYVLRFIQYMTIASRSMSLLNLNIYQSARTSRKFLRMLREFECWKTIREQYKTLNSKTKEKMLLTAKILTILQKLFESLFYICDHLVLLDQMGISFGASHKSFYYRSYKLYILGNLSCIIKSFIEILIVIVYGKYKEKRIIFQVQKKIIWKLFLDIIASILNVFVGAYYLKYSITAGKASAMGMASSLISIYQFLRKM